MIYKRMTFLKKNVQINAQKICKMQITEQNADFHDHIHHQPNHIITICLKHCWSRH